tara:strand:- start:381 stop:887 length:507 start_codon:yes stop_codon:yes gene_type:complete
MNTFQNNKDLMYLSNPSFIKKFKKKTGKTTIYTTDDYAFYKDRIKHMVRNLMNGKKVNTVIDSSFENFIEKSIEYLQFIDKRDILQKEYCSVDTSLNPIKIKNKFTLNETNELMVKKKEVVKDMSSYVKIKHKKQRKKIFIPEKRNINLKVEELKHKNIEEYNNISKK